MRTTFVEEDFSGYESPVAELEVGQYIKLNLCEITSMTILTRLSYFGFLLLVIDPFLALSNFTLSYLVTGDSRLQQK